MTSFAVDLELLAELTEGIAACGHRLAAVQHDVDARMTRVHATWQGQAAIAHAEAHERWRAGAAQMTEALTVLRTIAGTAHGNYCSAVQANKQMWAL